MPSLPIAYSFNELYTEKVKIQLKNGNRRKGTVDLDFRLFNFQINFIKSRKVVRISGF